MQQSLGLTTLGTLAVGSPLNVERAAKDGAEIGGHPLSGHVDCLGTLLSIRHPDGGVEKRTLANVRELRSTLTDMFGITLPASMKVDAALEGLFRAEGRA